MGTSSWRRPRRRAGGPTRRRESRRRSRDRATNSRESVSALRTDSLKNSADFGNRTGGDQVELREDVVRRAHRFDPRVFHRVHRGNGGYGEGNGGDRGEGGDAAEELGELRFLARSVRNDDHYRAEA